MCIRDRIVIEWSDWLIDWRTNNSNPVFLNSELIDWLTDWLIHEWCPFGCFPQLRIDWFINWLIVWLTDCYTYGAILDFLNWELNKWSALDWLIDSLTGWQRMSAPQLPGPAWTSWPTVTSTDRRRAWGSTNPGPETTAPRPATSAVSPNSKHWFTTSFLQPLPYLVTP